MTLHLRSNRFVSAFRRPQRLALTTALTLGVALPAGAASTSTTFNVTATVLNSCAVAATDLAFGNYDPASATDKTGTSTITVTCTLGTPFDMGLNNGNNASGSTRRMASGAARLTYQIYKDVGATQILGSVAASLGVSGVGTGAGLPTLIHGVIPKAQNVGAGAYSDVITVSVDY